MKWPFVRHSLIPGSSTGDTGSVTTIEPARAHSPSRGTDEIVVPSRRDWATLPPLHVAGGRQISLTAPTQAFTDGLASRQVLVRSARLEHVRQLDAPSGTFRGVLAPSTADDRDSAPELQDHSPLPAIEHRQLSAVPGKHDGVNGLSPIEQLLAIGEGTNGAAPVTTPTTSTPLDAPSEPGGEPRDGGGTQGVRRAGLADSRRRGLGPAYHGPLPEAMRAERERGDGGDPVTAEPVPADVRATMRDLLGLDVGDRLVHRGPAVSAEARAMGAQAFTRDGQVHVADEVGPLDQPTGRATLAHELTHAAQQIVHGSVPSEGSAAGLALEAHAQQVEQYVRGDGGAGKPSPEMLHARPPGTDPGDGELNAATRQMMRELLDSGLARSDGNGGIVFTMPPSSMTGDRGTQRQTATAPAAQPGAAARHENWSGLEMFGNTLAQGLGNDLLGMAGSVFGFSDEFMGEQRHELANQNREFERDQTKRAYTELRMEHLRTVALHDRNAEEAMTDHERAEPLNESTLHTIEQRVETEVTNRMQLLRAQTAVALQQLNEARVGRHEAALHEVPDENYDVAFHKLFDNPETDEVPAESELLTALTRVTPTGTGRATTPGGGTPTGAHPPGGAPTPTGTPASTTTPAHPTGTTPGSSPATGEHPSTTPGGTTGAATAQPDEPWRTETTMRGRFEGLGNALLGDVAHAELGFFGSLLGFDEKFEKGLHADIHPGHDAAAATPAATATPGAHPDAAHTDPAHTDAAHTDAAHTDAAHTAAAHGAAHAAATHSSSAATETVDHIVGDPYALDELATRLYPNIRTRLRQELLIDRERAGLLADFR